MDEDLMILPTMSDTEPDLFLPPGSDTDTTFADPVSPSETRAPESPETTGASAGVGQGEAAPTEDNFVGESIDYSSMLEKRWPGIDQETKDSIKTPEAYHGIVSANDAYWRIRDSDPVVEELSQTQGLGDLEYFQYRLAQANPMKTPSQIHRAMSEYLAEDGALSEESKTLVASLKQKDSYELTERENQIRELAKKESQGTVEYVKKLNGHIDTFTPRVNIKVNGEDVSVETNLSRRARFELNRFIHTNGAIDAISGTPTYGDKGHENLSESAMWLNEKTREELLSAVVKATEERVRNTTKK